MDESWRADAQEILDELQEKVSARDLPGLLELFEDPAVLIGAAGDGRTRDGRRAYLTAITAQTAAVRWDWDETTMFYEGDSALGFAAFGEIVLTDQHQEVRAPIRATFFAARTSDGWRLRQFHGSLPQAPPS